MAASSFEITRTESHTEWAQILDGRFAVFKTTAQGDEALVQWDWNTVCNLVSWMTDNDGPVFSALTGPMAAQVRDSARELGMTPEMFVWHAVKVFIEVGQSS